MYFKVLLISLLLRIFHVLNFIVMKKRIGIIGGFVLGVLFGFLAIVVMSKLHPEEDFAGVTILTVLISGVFFAITGSLIQGYLKKKKA